MAEIYLSDPHDSRAVPHQPEQTGSPAPDTVANRLDALGMVGAVRLRDDGRYEAVGEVV